MDEIYNRDDGESIMQINDIIDVTAYFETVAKLQRAYNILISDHLFKFITQIKP